MTPSRRPVPWSRLLGSVLAGAPLGSCGALGEQGEPPRPVPDIQIVAPEYLGPGIPFTVYLDIDDSRESREQEVTVSLLWDPAKLDMTTTGSVSTTEFDIFKKSVFVKTTDPNGKIDSPKFEFKPKPDKAPPFVFLAYYTYKNPIELRASDAHVIRPQRSRVVPPVEITIKKRPPNPGFSFLAYLSLTETSPPVSAACPAVDVYLCWEIDKFQQPTSTDTCPFHPHSWSKVWRNVAWQSTSPCAWHEQADFLRNSASPTPRYVRAHVTRAGDNTTEFDNDSIQDP